MTQKFALTGAQIFDGLTSQGDAALLISDGAIAGIVPTSKIPAAFECVRLGGGLLAPGFVDLQVNGGGGVLLNAQPNVEGIAQICAAHAHFGTTALLATLITDTPEIMNRAIE